ncbi:MAG TPA: c-type cytochrome [Gemmatimonadales bacterium]|jgi:mono/diheme cytochrome c family protein
MRASSPLTSGLLSLIVVAACARGEEGATADAASPERGRYLVTLGGCNDCHTPKLLRPTGPVPDSSRFLSGHPADSKIPPVPTGVLSPEGWGALVSPGLTAWAGPWGVSFTANLTPDATGLASWTAEQFIQTMRTGKHLGTGRQILPPMPWYDIGQLTDEDLRAVFAYLRTVKPVQNAVPAPLPPATAPAPQ